MPEVLAPLKLAFPAVPSSVPSARHAVSKYVARAEGRVDAERICIAVTEAAGNAVRHAYPGTEPGPVELYARWTDRSLLVRISDQGVGMSANHRGHSLGLGLRLVDAACDDYEIRANPGVTVRMVFTYLEVWGVPRMRRFRRASGEMPVAAVFP